MRLVSATCLVGMRFCSYKKSAVVNVLCQALGLNSHNYICLIAGRFCDIFLTSNKSNAVTFAIKLMFLIER